MLLATSIIAFPATAAALTTGYCLSGRLSIWLAFGIFASATILGLAVSGLPAGFLAWSSVMISVLTALAVFDVRTMTLPDGLSFLLIGSGMAHAMFMLSDPVPFIIGPPALLAASWLVAAVASDRHFRWIGGGDILLAAGALAWLGPFVFADFVLLSTVLAGAFAASQLAVRGTDEKRFAFAPAAGIAQITLWFGGPIL